MEKIVFLDEHDYRFQKYYNSRHWWKKNNINAQFIAYNGRSPFIILAKIISECPNYLVIVQTSRKNFFIARLLNFLGVKIIFWQHGVFLYNNKNQVTKKLNPPLHYLLCLSEYDRLMLQNTFFSSVSNSRVINHYDRNEIALQRISAQSDNRPALGYIAQIIYPDQILGSGAKVMEPTIGPDKSLENLLSYLQRKRPEYVVFYRKHPGDKSEYLESLSSRYNNFIAAPSDQSFFGVHGIVTHDSTMALAFLSLEVPVLQLPLSNRAIRIDLEIYRLEGKVFNYLMPESVDEFFYLVSANSSVRQNDCSKTRSPTISEEILSVVTSAELQGTGN